MSQQKKFILILAAGGLFLATLVVAAVWAVAGSVSNAERETSSEPVVTASSSATPGQEPVTEEDAKAAQEVALDAARIMTTWDPTEDESPMDSVRRASHLFMKDFADQINYSLPNTEAGLWSEMAAKNVVSVPQVKLQVDLHAGEPVEHEEANELAEGVVEVTVLATWTWKGENFTEKSDLTRMFFFGMKQDANQEWKATGYSFTDMPTRYLEEALW